MRPEIKGRGGWEGEREEEWRGGARHERPRAPSPAPPTLQERGLRARARCVGGRGSEKGERGGVRSREGGGERAARTRAGLSVRALVSSLTSFASTHTRRDGGRGGKKKGPPPLLLRARRSFLSLPRLLASSLLESLPPPPPPPSPSLEKRRGRKAKETLEQPEEPSNSNGGGDRAPMTSTPRLRGACREGGEKKQRATARSPAEREGGEEGITCRACARARRPLRQGVSNAAPPLVCLVFKFPPNPPWNTGD